MNNVGLHGGSFAKQTTRRVKIADSSKSRTPEVSAVIERLVVLPPRRQDVLLVGKPVTSHQADG